MSEFPAPLDKVNILLVDDQPSKLLSYEVILGELGENLIKANSPHEALGNGNVERGGNEKGGDVEIEKPRDGRRRVVRVERRKEQVARQGRLHGNARRFLVANLAHHDDVRILPQKRAEA